MSTGEISIDNRPKAIFSGSLRTTRNPFGALAKRAFDRLVDQASFIRSATPMPSKPLSRTLVAAIATMRS